MSHHHWHGGRRLTEHEWRIEAALLRYYEAAELADAILCPSGTDALLTTAMLLAAEQPGRPFTAILPSASETGTGVPLAASCRVFAGPRKGTSLIGWQTDKVEIPLRSDDASPRPDDAVAEAFAGAASHASGRPIVYLTHGTKTGLVAPIAIPPGVDVVVDACQGRVAPNRVAEYLRLGWPVVVTGSKFFGGPAFSGAVLFPRSRRQGRCFPAAPGGHDERVGTVLRWTAAMATMEAFQPEADGLVDRLRARVASIREAITANPLLVEVAGLAVKGPHWADQPTIFTFGVRDPSRRDRLLSEAELRPLYINSASDGVLLGQPVHLGSFGGLRVAIGARDLLDDPDGDGLRRLTDALAQISPGHSASSVPRRGAPKEREPSAISF